MDSAVLKEDGNKYTFYRPVKQYLLEKGSIITSGILLNLKAE
jgi:hypothetical protein